MNNLKFKRIYSKYPALLLLFITCLMLNCTQKNNQKEYSSSEKKILLDKINEFNIAFKECNIDKLESMITDNYIHTNGHSKPINKSSWINYLRKRKKEIDAGNLIIHKYEMNETELSLYNDVAVFSAKIYISSSMNGTSQINEYRVTNIWVTEKNVWKRAGFHDGKIK